MKTVFEDAESNIYRFIVAKIQNNSSKATKKKSFNFWQQQI